VQGRWSLVQQRIESTVSPTEWSAAIAQQLLVRHGIVMRETAASENIPGGYPSIYPVLKTMEESGLVRRGMFVAGLGAAQFATSAAVDLLRGLRKDPERPEVVHLAASDPANPYGSLLPWPSEAAAPHSLARAAGAMVVLVNGQLVAFLRRRNPALRVFLPENEPERTQVTRELARHLAEIALRLQSRHSGLLIETINDESAQKHFLGPFLEEAGFVFTANGFQMRRMAPVPATESALDA
jgi:ATP-dependent Lhr-like helicase